MRKGEIYDRLIAAAMTIAFMVFVQPDPEPSRTEATIAALLIYETIRFCSKYIRRMQRKKKKQQNNEALHYDARRWAETQLSWPIHEEVS